MSTRLSIVFEELRDAWAIAVAELTALVTFLFGTPLWIAAVSAGTVLGARVAAGLWLPREDRPARVPILTEDQRTVANLTVDGYSALGIARALGRSLNEVRDLQRAAYAAAGTRNANRLREWLRANDMRPRGSILRALLYSDFVKATVTIGGVYAVYQKMACPLLQTVWPGLQCP